MVVFLGTLLISLGIVGILYKVLNNQLTDLGKARSREIVRQSELAVVQVQNAQYQARLKDLETRINTIQALQNARSGPVELMNALGGVVNKTEDVYLYTLAPAGERLQLKGQSGTVDSMANFLAFLKKSGSFEDVQLDQFYQDNQHEHLAYKFTVSCQFRSAIGGPSPTSGAAPAIPSGQATSGPPGQPPAVPSQGAPPSQPTTVVPRKGL
jgi:Tfp pilus assembly protein PilN